MKFFSGRFINQIIYYRLMKVQAVVLILLLILSVGCQQETELPSKEEYKYCKQFKIDQCQVDRCFVSSSCYLCEDIGCFPKGHGSDW